VIEKRAGHHHDTTSSCDPSAKRKIKRDSAVFHEVSIFADASLSFFKFFEIVGRCELFWDEALALRNVHHYEVSTLAWQKLDWKVKLLELLGVHVADILEFFAGSSFISHAILEAWSHTLIKRSRHSNLHGSVRAVQASIGVETSLFDNLSRADTPSALPAGGIEKLATAPHGDSLVIVVPDRCKRYKLGVIECEEVVDFIADDHYLWVFLEDISNLLHLIDGEDLSSRILGVVQDQHLGFGSECPSQIFSVKDPLTIFQVEGCTLDDSVCISNVIIVARVAWLEYHNFLLLIGLNHGHQQITDDIVCTGSNSDLGHSINLSAELFPIELSYFLCEKRVTECACVLIVTLLDRVCQVVDEELRGHGCRGTLTQRDAVVFGSELLELFPHDDTGVVNSA
jgi:hypothetical protein